MKRYIATVLAVLALSASSLPAYADAYWDGGSHSPLGYMWEGSSVPANLAWDGASRPMDGVGDSPIMP